MKYGAILADPPWPWCVGGSRSPSYPLMPMDQLTALPVSDLAADNSCCFMWVIMPRITDGIVVLEAWGFRYVTVAFTWVKTNLKADSYFVGLGQWTRSNAEICLLGVRGHPQRKRRDVRQLIVAHRREHSRKPDEQYDRIEALVDGPYLELFARHTHHGWDAWGNEVKSNISLEARRK